MRQFRRAAHTRKFEGGRLKQTAEYLRDDVNDVTQLERRAATLSTTRPMGRSSHSAL